MKKLFHIFCLLLSLCLLSCKGEEEELPKNLRLSKVIETHPNTVKGITHFYTYTTNGELYEYKYQGGFYNFEGVIIHTYNTLNQLTETIYLNKNNDGTTQTKTIFNYDKAGLLTNFNNEGNKIEYSFKYDDQGRLVEINNVIFMLEFKYDTRGNIINQKQFIKTWDNPRKLNSDITIEYDTNPNPFYKLGSPFVHNYGQTNLNTHPYIISFSPNNPVKLTENHYYDSGQGETTEFRVKKFQYTYGKNNLPIEIIDLDTYDNNVSKLEYTVQ
ncbi:hypothetical protein GU926_16325 [Nibribacter ruber]|uniref:DUF4595 domain-containing protein n=1 Tax=Nibribacter ruber TaxID=2698458 RepID=A0A6P1P3C5_9BACT|nr:hypothetical protein [Nibribacter ruber]QHL88909.1 hypothetical protein GU926_16325 [Nibribacter ruber]